MSKVKHRQNNKLNLKTETTQVCSAFSDMVFRTIRSQIVYTPFLKRVWFSQRIDCGYSVCLKLGYRNPGGLPY